MKKFISTSVFAAALLIVGACSNNNGQVQAEPDYSKDVLTTLESGTKLYRYIDCENSVAVYFMNSSRSGVAVVNNVELNLIKKKCGK